MANPKPVFGAFNQGEIPTIACFNKANGCRSVSTSTR